MTAEELLQSEKTIGAEIDALTAESPKEAEAFVTAFLKDNLPLFSAGRAPSGALSRLLCRFLLHRKSKDFLVPTIIENDFLRRAFFGELNTCKYSLVYVFRRVLRARNTEINKEICRLLKDNPFRDDTARDYSERWSLEFIKRKALAGQNDAESLCEQIDF